jgi:hypothetical protein
MKEWENLDSPNDCQLLEKLSDRAGPARDMPDGLIIWHPSKPIFFKLFRPEEIAGDFRGTFACGNLNLLQNHIFDYSNDVLALFRPICWRPRQLPGWPAP